MVRDSFEVAEVLWAVNTGRPARSIDDYDLTTLAALTVELDTAKKEWERMSHEADIRHWTSPAPEIVDSGDPLIDKWERAIAEGRVPNLDEVP